MKMHEPEDALARGLHAVAEDDQQLGTSNAVGMRLLAEVQRIAAARRRRMAIAAVGAAAAVIAAVLVAAWPRDRNQANTQPTGAPVLTRELVTEFFPLAYSNVPARGGYVVRMQVPRSALASFVGAAASPLSNGGSPQVLADVVVGDDGLARAVRFVQIVSNDRQEQTP